MFDMSTSRPRFTPFNREPTAYSAPNLLK